MPDSGVFRSEKRNWLPHKEIIRSLAG